jgi:hypothetical protein
MVENKEVLKNVDPHLKKIIFILRIRQEADFYLGSADS